MVKIGLALSHNFEIMQGCVYLLHMGCTRLPCIHAVPSGRNMMRSPHCVLVLSESPAAPNNQHMVTMVPLQRIMSGPWSVIFVVVKHVSHGTCAQFALCNPEQLEALGFEISSHSGNSPL